MDEVLISTIREHYRTVLGQISEATLRSGRAAGAVRLVVVTKLQPVDIIRAVIAAGASIVGENYAEQAISKMNALSENAVEWHMIGHVQSRKADLVARHFSMLHSLDNLKLAGRLDQFCLAANRVLPVLLEVNVGGEETKFGFTAREDRHWSDLIPVFEEIASLPNLRVQGLMTMPPFFDDAEQARPYFRQLRHLREFLNKRIPQVKWTELSMGTSADFVAAIEEGATYVRVGQAILGPRAE